MTNRERSKAVKELLKKADYDTKDFSIRSYNCEDPFVAINIIIKNLKINIEDIESLLSNFENNIHINIGYDSNAFCFEEQKSDLPKEGMFTTKSIITRYYKF